MDPEPDADLETEERFPLVVWNPDDPDFDCEKFVVFIKTPGIEPLKRSKPHDAKNGTADVTIFKQGMDCKIEVVQDLKQKNNKKKKKKKTIYTFKVVRFPSPVNTMLSSWRVEKDEVVISLCKKEPIKWMPFISLRGIDQSSSSSNSSEEELLGAAAPKQKKGVLRLDDLAAGVKRLVVIEKKSKGSDSSSDDDLVKNLKKYPPEEEFKEH